MANYPDNVVKVLQEYGILDESGNFTQVDLELPQNAPLGPGPLLSPAVVDAFLDADTTPDKHWLNWMLFQAAGGETAKKATALTLEHMKAGIISEFIHGFTGDSGEYHPPVTPQEAEERYEKYARKRMEDETRIMSQDLAMTTMGFGFYRNWPGPNRRYEIIATAVAGFLSVYKKAVKMNQELVKAANDDLIPLEPSAIPNVLIMNQATRRVKTYFAAKKHRDNIQVDVIYYDKNLVALAPLTRAAAVKYGWHSWPTANPDAFEAELQDGKVTEPDGLVFITLKGPAPVISLEGNRYQTLRSIQVSNLDGSEWSFALEDFVRREFYTAQDIRQMLLYGVERADPENTGASQSDDEYSPIDVGRRVYRSAAEAEAVVKSFDAALAAIAEWHAKKRVLTDDE